MRKQKEVIKTRRIHNLLLEMQVVQFVDSKEWQATYYNGADPIIWSGTHSTKVEAIQNLDNLVDKTFSIINNGN